MALWITMKVSNVATVFSLVLIVSGLVLLVLFSPSAPPPAQLIIDPLRSVEWTTGGVIIPLRNVGGTACTINRVLVNGTDQQNNNLPFALASSEQKPAAINFTYELGAFYTFTFTFDGRDAAVTLESPASTPPC